METLSQLLQEVARCRICDASLPCGPRPVLSVDVAARLLIIGQAPGSKVHDTGIAWNDASGDRLRSWLQMDREQFYSDRRLAIMPMGFCYPGKGSSGDLPPRPECAPQWHARLLRQLPNVALTLLIGQYAQQYYLEGKRRSLTERVRSQRVDGEFFCLPHPSPRNIRWFRQNPWFDCELLPALQWRLSQLLDE